MREWRWDFERACSIYGLAHDPMGGWLVDGPEGMQFKDFEIRVFRLAALVALDTHDHRGAEQDQLTADVCTGSARRNNHGATSLGKNDLAFRRPSTKILSSPSSSLLGVTRGGGIRKKSTTKLFFRF